MHRDHPLYFVLAILVAATLQWTLSRRMRRIMKPRNESGDENGVLENVCRMETVGSQSGIKQSPQQRR